MKKRKVDPRNLAYAIDVYSVLVSVGISLAHWAKVIDEDSDTIFGADWQMQTVTQMEVMSLLLHDLIDLLPPSLLRQSMQLPEGIAAIAIRNPLLDGEDIITTDSDDDIPNALGEIPF